MAKLTFKDDKLIQTVGGSTDVDTNASGVLDKALVAEYIGKAKEDAKQAFATAIADLYQNYPSGAVATTVAAAYNKAIDDALNDTYVFSATNIEAMLKAQIKTAKEKAANDLAAYNDTSIYSNNVEDWSITTGASGALDLGEVLDASGNKTGAKYSSATVTGEVNKEFTAKGFVEAVVAKQTKVINGVSFVAADGTATNAEKIKTIEKAVKTAKDVISGHKAEKGALYYVEAVPTIADLEADTTLEAAKAKAIAQMESVLTSKSIALENEMDKEIAKYDKQAKLSAADQTKLDALKQAKADFAKQIAAVKEVYTARINNATTKTAVTALVENDTTGKLIADATIGITNFNLDSNSVPDTNTKAVLENAVTVCGYVDDLEAAAALYAQQKDVNGKPYYDADALQANLKEEVKKMYELDTTTSTTYTTAEGNLLKGFEKNLIDTKIAYIDFINGTAGSLQPKNSKGQKVTDAWNKTSAAAKGDSNLIAAMASGNNSSGFEKNISTKDSLYSTANKDVLKTLVSETEKAIEAAKSIAEVEKIFAEANDKYAAIETVNEHKLAWRSGTLGVAYTNGDYDTDLKAYVTAAAIRTENFKDYPQYDADQATAVKTVMDQIVYPVIYTASTADELAAKVAEAKTAVDKMLNKDAIAAQRKAVEGLIAGLGTITLESKEAIVAAADALDAYKDIPGVWDKTNKVYNTGYALTNEPILKAAINNYEDLAAKELDNAYKALASKTITTADADAVKALRAQYKAYAAFCDDYGATQAANPTSAQIKTIEDALLTAQVNAVKEMMIKLPVNPTEKDRAAVEAARAAYEALSLEGKARVIDLLPYQNLIDAEEALGLSKVSSVEALKITASSTAKKGSITIKWTVKGDADAAQAYEIWKSTKKNSGFKKSFTTKDGTKRSYKNTKGLKKGTRYYYKVRAIAYDANGKKITSDWSNKAYRKAK